MPELFGKEYPAERLRLLTSTMAQIAGIRVSELSDGRARGMHVAEVYTGSGFRFTVLIDRAMDVWAAEMAGKPIAWLHPALGGAELYEPEGYGWSRTWGGGLVTTAGITFFGHPEQDGTEALGLHGRFSHNRASNVKVTEEWRGDRYVLEIEGQTRQVALGEENLVLTRRISTELGATSFVIEDTVRNDAFRTSPHMILYHCNFDFPVISPGSELLINDEYVRPRDARAEAGFEGHTRFDEPMVDYPEQVFFHKPRVDSEGFSAAALANREIGFGAFVRYRAAELPHFAHWKMMGAGEYVCALEPANKWETPRYKLRSEGNLPVIEPGQEIHYRVEIGALPDAAAIQDFETTLKGA